MASLRGVGNGLGGEGILDSTLAPSLQEAIENILAQHHNILKHKLIEAAVAAVTAAAATKKPTDMSTDEFGTHNGQQATAASLQENINQTNGKCHMSELQCHASEPQDMKTQNGFCAAVTKAFSVSSLFQSELSCSSESGCKTSVLKTRHGINEVEEFLSKKRHERQMVIDLDKYLMWFSNIEEPPRSGFLANIVLSRAFDIFTTCIICCNTLATVMDTNWQMQNQSYNLPYAMQAAEVAFTACYFAEVLLKIMVHRCYYFLNKECKWNAFDFVLAVLGVVDVLLTLFSSTAFASPLFMRFLRLLRVLKKVSRVVRLLQFFTDLRLIMQCVIGSFFSLFWSIVLLVMVLLVFSMIFVQQLTSAMVEKPSAFTPEEHQSIHDRFGSVQVGVFSLFQCVAGGTDWADCYDAVKLAGQLNSFIFIVLIVLMWLSLTNIITSIFVDKAMSVAQPQKDELMLSRRRADLASAGELRELFSQIDHNHSNTVTKKELQESMKDVRLATYFELKGLDVQDIEMFCDLLADMSGNDEIDADTFIAGCLRMKGVATSMDLLGLHHELRTSQHRLIQQFNKSTRSIVEHSCQKLLEHALSSAMQQLCERFMQSNSCGMGPNGRAIDSEFLEADVPIYRSSSPFDLKGPGLFL